MTSESSSAASSSSSASPLADSSATLSLVEISEAFSKGAVDVFQIQFGLEAKISIEERRQGPAFKGPVLVGLGEIVSRKGRGEIGIVLPEPEFLKLMGVLLGTVSPVVTPEIEDGACEILNMVFGVAKDELNRKGAGVQPVRPRLVRGLEWEVRWEGAPEGRVVRVDLAGVGPVAFEFFIS